VIVIDASALVAYLLREEGHDIVREYMERGVASIELVVKEVLNAVYIAYRRGRVSREHVDIVFTALQKLLENVIELVDQKPLLKQALEISLSTGTTIYDALYIALARQRKSPLLTRDREQAKAAREVGVEVVEI